MMTQHSFTIALVSAKEALTRADAYLAANGGTFTGDETHGQFTGHGVVGYYHTIDGGVNITVIKKPALVPNALIETIIRKFFKAA